MRCRGGKQPLKPTMEGKRWALIHVAVSIYKSPGREDPKAACWEEPSSTAGPCTVLDPRWSRAGTAAHPPAALKPLTPGSAVIVLARR